MDDKSLEAVAYPFKELQRIFDETPELRWLRSPQVTKALEGFRKENETSVVCHRCGWELMPDRWECPICGQGMPQPANGEENSK